MKNFFDKGSPYLNHPLLTPERTAEEVDFLQSQWDLTAGARILDVGCGFGRHSIELARRGFEVTGIDPSQAMLEAAREGARQAGLAVDFQQAKGETFSSERRFDGAVCLFTSLGQVSGTGDNRALVMNVSRLLRDGGWFVVEVPQREVAVSNLRPMEQFGSGEQFTAVSREYEQESHRIREMFRLVDGHEERRFLLRYVLFSRREIIDLLQGAGFVIKGQFSNYQGQPLEDDAMMMIFTARKGI